MRSGKIARNVVTFQKPVTTMDDTGDAVVTWVDFITRRSSKNVLKGYEYERLGQTQTAITTLFTLRFISGLEYSMRIFSDDKYYDIRKIVDIDNRHRELLIEAVEKSIDQN